MPPADRNDLSGLLYLPGEELVRSTVEGVDADWSDAQTYVPSVAVVRRVLDAAPRARPRFLLPPSLDPSTRVVTGSSKRARAAAAMFGAFGLSPTALAGVMLGHVLALGAIVPWISAQVRTIDSRPSPRPPAVVVVPLAYRIYSPPPSPPLGTLEHRRASPPVRSTPRRGWASALTEREAAAALRQEFHLSGPGLEIDRADRPKLELMIRSLETWPGLRVRVVGQGPRSPEDRSEPGAREAEAFVRILVAAGIGERQFEIGRRSEGDQCPPADSSCTVPSMVRTMEAGDRRR